MGKLRSLERALTRAEGALLVALVAFMVSLSFLQVILRTFFSAGILWADTLLRHLVLWVAFLGAAAAAADDRQFAMDMMHRILRGNLRRAVKVLCHAFSCVVCLFLARASWLFFQEEYNHAAPLFTAFGREMPAWPFELILPLGFVLLALHYLIKTTTSSSDGQAQAPRSS